MKTLTVALFILLSCQIGHALECYKCNYGSCAFPALPTTTCSPLQSCISYNMTAGGIPYKKKGCVDSTECLKETTETYMGFTVKANPSCCITDLCNSAVIPRVSAITGIAVLVSLWLAKLF